MRRPRATKGNKRRKSDKTEGGNDKDADDTKGEHFKQDADDDDEERTPQRSLGKALALVHPHDVGREPPDDIRSVIRRWAHGRAALREA